MIRKERTRFHCSMLSVVFTSLIFAQVHLVSSSQQMEDSSLSIELIY